jgi:hypothetical protein
MLRIAVIYLAAKKELSIFSFTAGVNCFIGLFCCGARKVQKIKFFLSQVTSTAYTLSIQEPAQAAQS